MRSHCFVVPVLLTLAAALQAQSARAVLKPSGRIVGVYDDVYLDGALLGGNQPKPVVLTGGRIVARRGAGDDLNQFQVSTIAGIE